VQTQSFGELGFGSKNSAIIVPLDISLAVFYALTIYGLIVVVRRRVTCSPTPSSWRRGSTCSSRRPAPKRKADAANGSGRRSSRSSSSTRPWALTAIYLVARRRRGPVEQPAR